MTKIFSSPNDKTPQINKRKVAEFFRERAQKVGLLGTVRAVIYQDKHPDLAEKRDAMEKERLLPLINLDGSQRVLDIGCGTGRWTTLIAGNASHYHGIDFSAELIAHAQTLHPESDNLRYSIASAEEYSLPTLGEVLAFDRILCCGIMIYLNDKDVEDAFSCMAAVAARKCRVVLREPIGLLSRLTIKEHFSDELEQNYNAIYRTREELLAFMEKTLFPAGFVLVAEGDVYDTSLNNRTETIQRWMVLERM